MESTIWVTIGDRKVPIKVEKDCFPDIPFETPASPELPDVTSFREKIRTAANDPARAKKLLLRDSNSRSDTQIVAAHPGEYLALETLYTFPERNARGEVTPVDARWETILLNAMAVRNRRLVVRRLISILVKEVGQGQGKNPVEVASIGCGSGRPVLEALAHIKAIPFQLHLIDLSKDALDFSRSLAKQLGVSTVKCILGTSANLLRREWESAGLVHRPTVHIAEMVGLLDYFVKMSAVKMLRTTRRAILPGGYLITGNIMPNNEMSFVKNGIGWELVYRTEEELVEILCETGFLPENIELIIEPLGIYCLALCKLPDGINSDDDKD